MSQLTPPSSHSGTPVKTRKPVERSRNPPNAGGPSSHSPVVDTDDSDVELIKTDGSDAEIDEAMDEEEEIDIPIEAAGQLQSEGVLTPAQSQDQISKDEPVLDPSIKGARAVQAAKTVKGKKKDADLFESDIVSRWNREIGDVCAPGPPLKA